LRWALSGGECVFGVLAHERVEQCESRELCRRVHEQYVASAPTLAAHMWIALATHDIYGCQQAATTATQQMHGVCTSREHLPGIFIHVDTEHLNTLEVHHVQIRRRIHCTLPMCVRVCTTYQSAAARAPIPTHQRDCADHLPPI
jgi:hypothetical protein